MAIFRRFRVQQKYVNGQPTEEYRLGVEVDGTNYHSLEACQSGSECTELEYRWVDMESADDYICDGTNKYKKQKKQQKCITEEAWTDVYPYEYQKGEIIEQNSVDCGYEPSVEYHIYGATDGHGSINISPSKEYYSSTDIVTITALPSTNYMFSCYNYGGNMTYGSVAYNSVLSLTMSHNWYVSAVFRSVAPSVGSLYYSYYNGTESWYEWSKSTLSDTDNSGRYASIIIDYSGVIQTIPSSAFSYRSYLISINFPLCTYVGDDAFRSCYKLQSVNLPLCEHLGYGAFENCSGLQLIDLPVCSSIGLYTFFECYILASVNLPNCTFVGSSAFEYCRALSSISLPLCEYIGNGAFRSCYKLQFIDLSKCSKVGGYTFQYCTSLQSVSLPLCTSVHDYVFADCTSLTYIDLPLCTYVSNAAFFNCSNLRIVHLPKVMSFRGSVFTGTVIETLYMDQITSVPSGGDPFGSAISNLKSIIIPCSLVNDFLSHSIWSKYSSYYVCTGGSEESNLKEIFTSTDGGGVVTLDPEGGKYYSGTTVNIGYSANPGYVFSYFQYGSTPAYGSTVLNESFSLLMSQNWYVSAAFTMNASSGNLYYSYFNGTENWYNWSKSTLSKYDNNGIKASIIIDYGGDVQTIPTNAFSSHSYLTKIVFPNCLEIGNYAFSYCTLLSYISLPNCLEIGDDAFAFTSLPSIDLQNCTYVSDGAFAGCTSLKSVNLPLCEHLGYGAFAGCYSLSYINLSNCKFLKRYVFCECSSLVSINLQNCSFVGDYTFWLCISLKYINLPLCEYIDGSAFKECSALQNIDLPLCNSVGIGAFEDCSNLRIVHLPKVTYIGSSAFYSAHIETLYMDQITSVPSGGDPFINSIYIKSIFIPSSLLDSFVSHQYWEIYSSYFVCV